MKTEVRKTVMITDRRAKVRTEKRTMVGKKVMGSFEYRL